MSPEDKMELREWCVKEREDAQKSVENYENRRMTCHIKRDDGPLEDITAKQLADAKRTVADMDDLIAKLRVSD